MTWILRKDYEYRELTLRSKKKTWIITTGYWEKTLRSRKALVTKVFYERPNCVDPQRIILSVEPLDNWVAIYTKRDSNFNGSWLSQGLLDAGTDQTCAFASLLRLWSLEIFHWEVFTEVSPSWNFSMKIGLWTFEADCIVQHPNLFWLIEPPLVSAKFCNQILVNHRTPWCSSEKLSRFLRVFNKNFLSSRSFKAQNFEGFGILQVRSRKVFLRSIGRRVFRQSTHSLTLPPTLLSQESWQLSADNPTGLHFSRIANWPDPWFHHEGCTIGVSNLNILIWIFWNSDSKFFEFSIWNFPALSRW